MQNLPEENLLKLGLVIPPPVAPVAQYVPYTQSGNTYYISGQIPFTADGELQHVGKLGDNVTDEDGYNAAQQCALNVLSHVNHICNGELSRVKQILKISVFVNCRSDFRYQPEVANGASDLFLNVFGEAGRHARTAVGTNALPRNSPVEVDAIIELFR